jgi:hypothetical protein
MNPPTHLARARFNADPDLVLLDFAQDHAEHPEEALAALQLLVLDRDSCLGRIAALRAAAENGQQAPGPTPPPREDFTEEIKLLAGGRLFDAHAERTLTGELVARLHRLTCDPEALWRAHRLAAARAASPSAATAVSEDTALTGDKGFTSVLQAGSPAQVEEAFRPWLPFLLEAAGLGAALAEPFLAFILEQRGQMQGRRFREVVNDWLRAFAEREGCGQRLRPLRDEDYPAVAGRGAVVLTLRQPAAEPDWARACREFALVQNVSSWRELVRLTFPEELAAQGALPIFIRSLGREAASRESEGLKTMLQ